MFQWHKLIRLNRCFRKVIFNGRSRKRCPTSLKCGGGMAWWRINYGGQVGWTAEGYGNTDWLEPLSGCANTLLPRLIVGRWARVTPGLPNLLRNGPSTAYPVLARLRGGSVFLVLDGPHCSNGMAWWQVSY